MMQRKIHKYTLKIFKMNSKFFSLMLVFLLSSAMLNAQKNKDFEVKSPDGAISLHIEAGAKLLWSVQHNGQQIIAPSSVALHLQGGEVLGDNAKIISSKSEKNSTVITPINYKKASIPDEYNQLTLNFKGDYGLIFR